MNDGGSQALNSNGYIPHIHRVGQEELADSAFPTQLCALKIWTCFHLHGILQHIICDELKGEHSVPATDNGCM